MLKLVEVQLNTKFDDYFRQHMFTESVNYCFMSFVGIMVELNSIISLWLKVRLQFCFYSYISLIKGSNTIILWA